MYSVSPYPTRQFKYLFKSSSFLTVHLFKISYKSKLLHSILTLHFIHSDTVKYIALDWHVALFCSVYVKSKGTYLPD